MHKHYLLPNFILVGAAKSGTNSIFNYLKEHPEVFMPEEKEPHFFSAIERGANGYNDKEQYTALFRNAGDATIRGEASTGYFFDPACPERIRATLGDDIKLMCILRNPAQAIYSSWGQLVRMRLETRSASKAILSSFDSKQWDIDRWTSLYAYTVQYAEHISRFHSVFPPEQLKIYIFEEFFSDGMERYRDLCRFLGVSDTHVPNEKTHNKGFIWQSPGLNSFILNSYGKFVYPIAKWVSSEKMRNRVKNYLTAWNSKTLPQIDAGLQVELEKRLAPGVRDLEKLLGRDLSKLWF